jgi:hypothetical protein
VAGLPIRGLFGRAGPVGGPREALERSSPCAVAVRATGPTRFAVAIAVGKNGRAIEGEGPGNGEPLWLMPLYVIGQTSGADRC